MGRRLSRVADEIWAAEAPLRFKTLELGTRMVVVRLAGNRLWLWSPIPVDASLESELAELGTVAYGVAPNLYHHLFLADFAKAYPGALLFGAPGLAAKRPDLGFHAELSDSPPDAWRDEIGQVFVSAFEVCRELAFFHRPTGTLLAADLLFNVGREAPARTRLGFRLLRAFGRVSIVPDVGRQLRRSGALGRGQLTRVRAWPAKRLIPAHGAIFEGDVPREIERALARRRIRLD